MPGTIPDGKFKRGVITGATTARVGVNMANYLLQRPFLDEEGRDAAREKAEAESARLLFSCCAMLKGAALKAAQLLSLELELVPAAVRKEFEKSCNQVPPMNRVLARKAAANALGRDPGEVFAAFDATAFAAASLGQVHAATGPEGQPLAVKLQYPGIRQAIGDDMRLIRATLGRLPEVRRIAPVFDEIEARLLEETDYLLEAENMAFFHDKLDVDGVCVPTVWRQGCRREILCAQKLSGLPLNQWLKTNPGQEARNLVAGRLNEVFLQSLYRLGRIHADPNPGNFVIGEGFSLGLVDFGCVKTFTPQFVALYRKLPRAMIRGDRDEYFNLLQSLRFLDARLDSKAQEAIFEAAYGFGRWLGRLYAADEFDFAAQKGYLAEGRELSRAMWAHRRHFSLNPDMVFLDRTRYGLLRIYEMLGCRIRLRNAFEWSADGEASA
jgi:predicted unusual protein kinase regulating ubiquinone biosynthesis (AarF/ABC1/UbiB family)